MFVNLLLPWWLGFFAQTKSLNLTDRRDGDELSGIHKYSRPSIDPEPFPGESSAANTLQKVAVPNETLAAHHQHTQGGV